MKVVIHPQYSFLESFIRAIPENFQKEGKTIYKGRNELKVFDVQGVKVNVKSFCIPHIINRIAYSSIRRSKAARSYIYGLRCLGYQVDTPHPIAYVETYKWGWIGPSYYISLQEENVRNMKHIYTVPDEETKSLLEAYARFTAFMHGQGVFHKDYSPGNILFKETQEGFRFSIIDLNRMEFGPVGMEKGCSAFRANNMHEEQINWIADVYARERCMDPEICRDLIRSYHDTFWKNYLRRHPDWERVYI